MKKILVAMVAVAVVALAGASLARAQEVALFKAPFPFIVDGKVLPAGSYRVTPQGDDISTLLISSTTTPTAAAFAAAETAANPDPRSDQVHVAFKNIDGQYFLWQVSMPHENARRIALTRSEAEHMLVKLNLMPAEHADAGSTK